MPRSRRSLFPRFPMLAIAIGVWMLGAAASPVTTVRAAERPVVSAGAGISASTAAVPPKKWVKRCRKVRVGRVVRNGRVIRRGKLVRRCRWVRVPAPKPTPKVTPAPTPTPPASQPVTPAPTTVAPPAAASGEIRFSPASFWHQPLAASHPLAANSAALAGEVNRQVQAYGPWVNIRQYSTPIYTVAATQPTVGVRVGQQWDAGLRAAWAAVPIPAGAVTADGTDRHMVVWQPSTDTMWEFFDMRRDGLGWIATWGGRMNNVSQNPGYFPRNPSWGATATGLPLVGGTITVADLRRGRIDHPIALALVETQQGVWSWPAQRTDGRGGTPGATPVPEGARFRLDPNVNIDALGLPPVTRMIAKAAQTYGMIVRDKSGAVVMFMEDPKPYPTDPYPALLGAENQGTIGRDFPWRYLQALPLDPRTS